MSCKDHNETLAMLYAAIAAFYSCGIIAAPWIIEKNFRRPEQIPTAILVFGSIATIALLFWLAAIFMYQRKSFGRTLALIAAPITIFAFWSVGIYAWWFLHSYGGKALYGIEDDSSASDSVANQMLSSQPVGQKEEALESQVGIQSQKL